MQKYFKSQLLKTACGPIWKKVGLNPHHGVVIMLSSLSSKKESISGEFFDLIPLIEWAPTVGLNFLQLLPILDTGFDNSPYNPVSTLALNYIYLSLEDLPYVSKDAKLKKHLKHPKKTSLFNYSRARGLKYKFLEKYYEIYFDNIQKKTSYQQFLKANLWVKDYSLYCALCEEQGTDQWHRWPKSLQNLNSSQKKTLLKKHASRAQLYQMIQYFCFEQLHQVKKVADKHKVKLMGDLPFLVSKNSCDVWTYPTLFHRHIGVGSPPDDLTPDGQDWNFPAYNWQAHKKSSYRWWKMRLKIAEQFFHLYRLDHVIGFFRTWNIPEGKKGKDGKFCPEDPAVWLNHGKDFLSVLIKNSSMLPIGEDLVIPQTIKDVLRELGICGTNILTWQRTGAGGQDFVPFPLYTAATITHLASHDTVTLNQWWKDYPEVSKQYALWKGWKYTKTLDAKKRMGLLYDSHHTSSIFHANLLAEYLALFPEMVHKDYNQERINYPGTPSSKNWRYRFVPTVEEITHSKKLSKAFSSITAI